MQLNWKLIQYYSTNTINVAIGLLLYLYDVSLIFSLVLLILNGIVLLLSILIIQKQKKLIPKKYFQQFMNLTLSVHISYCCFLDKDLARITYILLKALEIQMVKKQSIIKSLLLHLAYNILFFILFIIHKENAISYVVTVYCTLLLIKIKYSSINQENQEFELPAQMTKPTQRNSEIINLIQDSISNSWLIRLQNIPVGIMIVKKNNLQIMFQNQSLLQMFDGIKDIPKFLMNELQFKLQIKRKRKQVKETSIKLPKQSPKQYNSIPQFFSCNKVPSVQRLPNTLNEILVELQNGNLDQFYSKENNLELLAQLSKSKYSSFQEEDYTRQIQCKIFCGQNDNEYLIIMDDISLQSYLQKLETREKFQVRIIDSFSHELRTPLNSAKLFLDGLINDPSINENHKYNFIYPASNALKLQAYLIRDIIDFIQFHSQIIKYKFEEFNFEDIVQEVNDLFRPILQMKYLGLHIIVKNTVPPLIYSDFDRIMQILVNLISNSIKFSERGLITLEISCYDSTLTFCVKDQGVGIESDQLQKIQEFLKSFNQNRDFSCHDEWQGLGLLVSQMNLFKLAPLNKTYLKINSTGLGEGTQVTFKIRTTQTSNTQILGTTIKRQSLRTAYTVPDLCMGIQGILIINNPKTDDLMIDKKLQQIPIRHHSSIANYFRPQQSTGLLNQYVQPETDLQDEDTQRGNLQGNVIKLNSSAKIFYTFINNKELREKSIKRRKKSSFSISEIDIQSSKRPNTLISRLIQREEQEIEMEEKFDNLQFPCQCARILSVDDDLFNQKALQVIIGQMGFRLLIAYNGYQAVELIQNTEKCSESCKLFHFILMDCQMPIMDGWTTTKVLMDLIRDKQVPDIPIIGLTAFNSTEDINRCFEVGMRDVLTKPLNINQLKQALLKLFN
ncbi:unnamed protein product (macronuclear) [Paramecium tetraurelia]|uniref:Response regulatory domain-containing protein n=1 Tax=Paramecium tetraurelia TaxID=5888 RepID=A0BWM8_PARTE|nr:uncharacterized protein GSPATT00032797001 [Paramecium tetraurelia]CAK62945.1 unnamed protein product [Paramecium tetraurelia]|eukprot:XP_001430343.1 hypothetical protein (macronuclear) [Paramecium tetraurelia strain d4-2]